MGTAARERHALMDTMLALGPDAPTLCEGWQTRDLVAHLVVRERRPDAMPGIVIPAFAGHTARVIKATAAGDYAGLVASLHQAPLLSPYRLAAVDDFINTTEYAIHHEDARRGVPGWKPRPNDPDLDAVLWSRLSMGTKLMLRKSPVSIGLVHTDGRRVGPADPAVTVTGDPLELTLFCFGRQSSAEVTVDGSPADVAAAKSASLGL